MLDVLIIGSGPAGLSAAVYAKRASLRTVVLEKVYYSTGQIAQSSQVDNYLGLVGIGGYELGTKFREHAEKLGVEFQDGEADGFEAIEGGWRVLLKGKEPIEAKTVIYAAGATHRHLGVPGEEALEGCGVSYCATCDGAFFKGKKVAVIGGGDTAMDDALYLSELCETVYLIHRRSEFRGMADTLSRIQEKENIKLVTNAQIASVQGEGRVTGVVLKDGQEISVDGVFIAVGMQPQTEAVKEVVHLDDHGYIVADETGITDAKGFFVAGDVRTKVLRQVVTAVSDGANAAFSAGEYLRKVH